MVDSWEMGWEVRAFNGGLRRRRLERGLTQKELARIVGCSPIMVSHIETLQAKPGEDLLIKLAACLECMPEDVWPEWLESRRKSLRAIAYSSVTAQEFSALVGPERKKLLALPAPEKVDSKEAGEVIESVLGTIGKRDAEIVRMRYGLYPHGRIHTLEECAVVFGLSSERIKQLEYKALLKLKHPARCARLEPLLREMEETRAKL